MSSTQTQSPRTTILSIYEAFGRGDLPGILAAIADEVDWGVDPDAPVARAVPWLARVRTRDEVAARYFAGVVGDLEWHDFRPVAVAVDGDQVVSVIEEDYTVRATGRRVRTVGVHHFTLGPDGRIVRYRPVVDTEAMMTAYAGSRS